jgi:hypothetical protein
MMHGRNPRTFFSKAIEDKAVGEGVRREIGSNGVGVTFPVFLPNPIHNPVASQMVAVV